jgi:hypothetical protein
MPHQVIRPSPVRGNHDIEEAIESALGQRTASCMRHQVTTINNTAFVCGTKSIRPSPVRGDHDVEEAVESTLGPDRIFIGVAACRVAPSHKAEQADQERPPEPSHRTL